MTEFLYNNYTYDKFPIDYYKLIGSKRALYPGLEASFIENQKLGPEYKTFRVLRKVGNKYVIVVDDKDGYKYKIKL